MEVIILRVFGLFSLRALWAVLFQDRCGWAQTRIASTLRHVEGIGVLVEIGRGHIPYGLGADTSSTTFRDFTLTPRPFPERSRFSAFAVPSVRAAPPSYLWMKM